MTSASQQGGDTETVGVIARPPFLFLACLILGRILDRVLPLPVSLPETALLLRTAGGVSIVLGVATFAAGVGNFSRAATPVPSTRPVRTLVPYLERRFGDVYRTYKARVRRWL